MSISSACAEPSTSKPRASWRSASCRLARRSGPAWRIRHCPGCSSRSTSPASSLPQPDRNRLASLAFPYIEARHRLGLIDADLEARLLAARQAFARSLPDDLKGAVEFYEGNRYIAAASVQDNMLFGRLV